MIPLSVTQLERAIALVRQDPPSMTLTDSQHSFLCDLVAMIHVTVAHTQQPSGQQHSEVLPCVLQGVNCIGYAPLGHAKPDFFENSPLHEVAKELGRTPAQVRHLNPTHDLQSLVSTPQYYP